MNIADIRNMSTIERIQIMEEIWDSFIYENKELESPDWHEKILHERKKDIASGKVGFISLEELKKIRKR